MDHLGLRHLLVRQPRKAKAFRFLRRAPPPPPSSPLRGPHPCPFFFTRPCKTCVLSAQFMYLVSFRLFHFPSRFVFCRVALLLILFSISPFISIQHVGAFALNPCMAQWNPASTPARDVDRVVQSREEFVELQCCFLNTLGKKIQTSMRCVL